jgi:hypothetical protein
MAWSVFYDTPIKRFLFRFGFRARHYEEWPWSLLDRNRRKETEIDKKYWDELSRPTGSIVLKMRDPPPSDGF